MFLENKDTGELVEDEKIEQTIKNQTSEVVFRATGGTNIESALDEISSKLTKLSTTCSMGKQTPENKRPSNFEIFFVFL